MNYFYPLAVMANTFAMTILLIALGISGKPGIAAEVGIVQGATLALFYAFSANARSLILGKSLSAHSILAGRLLLLLPLSSSCYWLSVGVAGVDQILACILILRRCVEWVGEVHLSEEERLGNLITARRYLILQCVLLTLAIGWLVSGLPFSLVGLFAWAFFPLLFSGGFIIESMAKTSLISATLIYKLLPHLGSTVIIGITVYVFRLLILLLLGKDAAGDLYTAFAIGGLVGSVFANALGASIAFHEQSIGKNYTPPLLAKALAFSFFMGVLVLFFSILEFSFLEQSGKSYLFWKATGYSLIGGVMMVFAQRIRFRMLQDDDESNVFGPDVMTNVLLISSIPFVFYLLGKDALSGLYLLSALLSFVFYHSAEKGRT